MCWVRAWSQILLPVFLSLVLIQLFISFSDNRFFRIHHHRHQKTEKALTLEQACAEKNSCPLCTEDKRCVWCREDRICKKYCFPYSGCQFSSLFWANCRVDMFGIFMLILIVLLLIGFLWYLFSFYFFMQRRQTYFYGGRGPLPGHSWQTTAFDEY